MRQVVDGMEKIWLSGDYTGEQRPVARVTVQHPAMKLHHYALRSTFTKLKASPSGIKDTELGGNIGIDPFHGERIDETYANYLFSAAQHPRELPNVKAVSWTRSLDTDVATCQVTLWNTDPLPIGATPTTSELDRPGWFTYNRGAAPFSSRWKHKRNEWYGMLMPDNVIRTYEGYGFDPNVSPEQDPNLMLTGVWMIDSVTMGADGTFNVACRDLGRLLVDQISWAPVIPAQFYPLTFQNWDEKIFIGYKEPARARLKVTATASSNDPWDQPVVAGHRLSHAFDGNPSTFWLSVGNIHPSRRFAYEFVEASLSDETVTEMRFRTKKYGYTAYVAVQTQDGVWQGRTLIDYHEDGIGRNGANTHYVKSKHVNDEGEQVITFPAIKHAVAIRLVLGHLQDFGFGPYQYRGGIRDVAVYGLSKTQVPKYANLKPGPAGANPGRYQDYTDIVKILCCWAGLYWPKGGYQLGTQRWNQATRTWVAFPGESSRWACSPTKGDAAVLGNGIRGRAWGDFMNSGTSGPVPMTIDVFDKKTLMEGVAAIRDILGFVFFIDETGGAQWRMPNIFQRGNWVTNAAKPGRTQNMYAIDESQILVSLEAQINSTNVREALFVGDPVGHHAALTPGYNPNPTGLRRIAGWTDPNFASVEEAQLMGEMIALRQLFSYRNDQIQIPGFPGIQIDDQVRIYERVSSEGFIHYVKGISSSLDMTAGVYTFDLQTHWLGNDPKTSWVFDRRQLTKAARDYVNEMVDRPPGIIPRPGRPPL